MKKAFIALAAVVLVIIVAAVVAPFVIDLNQYKGQILERVRPAVGRDVDFESVELTVLTGLGAELTGLKVPENPAFAGDDFLTLESLQVRLKILPLLKGQVQVSELVFKSPVVRIRRDEQGTFNFQDMIAPPRETVPAREPAKPREPGQPAGEQPPSVLAVLGVDKLSIKDGELLYEDRQVSPQGKGDAARGGTFQVSGLDASIEDLSLSTPVSIDIRGSLSEGSGRGFRVTGTVGPVGPKLDLARAPVNLRIRADSLPVAGPLGALDLPVKVLSGTLKADISAAGSLDKNLDASWDLDLGGLVLDAGDGGQEKPQKTGAVDLKLSGKALYTAQGEVLALESTGLEINRNRIELKGTVERLLSAPAWNLTLRSDNLEPGSLVGLIPADVLGLPAGLALSGPARLEIRSSGSAEDFGAQADADMRLMEIAFGDVFSKAGGVPMSLKSTVAHSKGVLTIKSLDLGLHNLLINATGSVDMGAKSPAADVKIAAKPFALEGWEKLVPMLTQYGLQGEVGVITAEISGPLDNAALKARVSSPGIAFVLPAGEGADNTAGQQKGQLRGATIEASGNVRAGDVSGSGTLNVESGSFADIALKQASADFRYAKGLLEVPRFSAGVFNGGVTGSASYNTLTQAWTVSPVIDKVDSGQALTILTPFKDIFEGVLSGNMSIQGSAQTDGIAALHGQGELRIGGGRINNLDLARAVAEGLTGLEGIGSLIDTEQEAVQRNRETGFDSLVARFELAGQTLNLTSFALTNIRTGKDTVSVANLKGTVGLIDQALNLDGNITLSKKHSERLIGKTPALEALADPGKQIVLPIAIKGSMTRPAATLKVSDINKAVAEYYTTKGLEKGLEKLFERLGKPRGE